MSGVSGADTPELQRWTPRGPHDKGGFVRYVDAVAAIEERDAEIARITQLAAASAKGWRIAGNRLTALTEKIEGLAREWDEIESPAWRTAAIRLRQTRARLDTGQQTSDEGAGTSNGPSPGNDAAEVLRSDVSTSPAPLAGSATPSSVDTGQREPDDALIDTKDHCPACEGGDEFGIRGCDSCSGSGQREQVSGPNVASDRGEASEVVSVEGDRETGCPECGGTGDREFDGNTFVCPYCSGSAPPVSTERECPDLEVHINSQNDLSEEDAAVLRDCLIRAYRHMKGSGSGRVPVPEETPNGKTDS